MNFKIYNEDCVEGAKKIKDQSVDLIICDPPFGINETSFHKHYARNEANIIDGYIEAPEDYQEFSNRWIAEAKRILKPTGTLYIISGWSKLREILNSCHYNNMNIINHCIWKFNFGVNTTKKWVTSHYHVLMIGDPKKITFNTFCRFGQKEKDENDKSLLYKDMEDVFVINKEFQQGEMKNKNKLPDELIKKLLLYSSKEGDVVCDFFMGNFTTAYCSLKFGRNCIGFEMNKNSYDHHVNKLKNVAFGENLRKLKLVDDGKPKNQGKKIEKDEKEQIIIRFNELRKTLNKKNSIQILENEFGRGKFSIINILKEI
jgi:site-specific DNA-methyltransferase (adenine-specific)